MTVTTKFPKWAEFCRPRMRPPFIESWTWRNWKAGRSRPTTELRLALHVFWNEDEKLCEAANWPCSSVLDLDRKSEYNRRKLERHKLKYTADQEYRNAILSKQRDRHRKNGYKPQTIRNIELSNLTPEQRKYRTLALRRANRLKNYKPKVRRITWGKVRSWLTAIRRRADRIDAYLSRPATKPWHKAGCLTMDQWKRKDHAAWHEYKLAYWKAASNRKDSIKLMAKGNWSAIEWYRTLKKFGYKCAYCGADRNVCRRSGNDIEADHIIALQAWKIDKRLFPACANTLDNLAPACKTCNTSKSNDDLIEWARRTNRVVHPIALEKYRKQMSKCATGPIQTDLRELMYG